MLMQLHIVSKKVFIIKHGQILTDFRNVCTAGMHIKFAIKPIRCHPPHRKHVATLPWEIKKPIFAVNQQIWKKMQTNYDIFGA